MGSSESLLSIVDAATSVSLSVSETLEPGSFRTHCKTVPMNVKKHTYILE